VVEVVIFVDAVIVGIISKAVAVYLIGAAFAVVGYRVNGCAGAIAFLGDSTGIIIAKLAIQYTYGGAGSYVG